MDTKVGHLDLFHDVISKWTKVSRLIVPFEPMTRYMENDSINHNHLQYVEDFLVPQDNLSIKVALAKGRERAKVAGEYWFKNSEK